MIVMTEIPFDNQAFIDQLQPLTAGALVEGSVTDIIDNKQHVSDILLMVQAFQRLNYIAYIIYL